MPDDERRPGRRQVYRRAELRKLIDPESIAIIGASPRENSFGDRVRRNLAGFRGRVHLVNARYERIEDMPCHPASRRCPRCRIARSSWSGARRWRTCSRDCAEAGVRNAIVFASGYSGNRQARPRRAAGAPRRARRPARHPADRPELHRHRQLHERRRNHLLRHARARRRSGRRRWAWSASRARSASRSPRPSSAASRSATC